MFIAFSNLTTRSNTALGIESQGFSAACEIPLRASGGFRPSVEGMTEDPFVAHRILLFTVAHEMLAESVSIAMLTVLETLGPTERGVRAPRGLRDAVRRDRRSDREVRGRGYGADSVAKLLARANRAAATFETTTVWLNGAPAGRIEFDGELGAAVSLVVENRRVTRIYVMRNPRKLARLDQTAELAR